MKRITFLTTLASLAVLGAQGQEVPPPKVAIKGAKIAQVDTPMFSASNVGDRKWRPKSWLELDVAFEIRLPNAAGGRNGSLESMVANVFVAFNHKGKGGGTQYAKGSFTMVDIPASEDCHLLVYLSPGMLRRIFEKDGFSATSDIQGWGVELVLDGEKVAVDGSPAVSKGSPGWWESPALEIVDGQFLSKKETPFSILWGDYDVSVKKQ